MAKIHIALVGKQPAPVCNGILMTAPDAIVYIFSDESRDTVELLRKQLPLNEYKQPPLDAIDPKAINARAAVLAEKFKEDTIILNISSGPKSWTYLFGLYFSKLPNVEVIYIDQNNTLWNYTSGNHTADCPFDMDFLLRLYGNTIKKNNIKDYTSSDTEVQKKIEEIRKFNHKDFNRLTTVLSDEWKNLVETGNDATFTLESGSFIVWEKGHEGQLPFVRIFLKNKKGESREVCLESPYAVNLTFNSGWFEYKVAKMLSQWSEAKAIYMNCIFPAQSGLPKNEVDIIVQTKNKLLFVECKTQISKTIDIDKFRTVVKGYGGTASKALFVTDAPMTALAKEKCKQSDIMMFSMAEPHLGMSPETAIAMLLNQNMDKINV